MSRHEGQQVTRNGWLRTATRVSLPEVHASIPVARAGGFWRKIGRAHV